MKSIKSYLKAHRWELGTLLVVGLAALAGVINPLDGGLIFAMALQLPTRGRLVQVKRGTSPGVLIPGVRTKSISVNGEPIDITNDDDLGWRKLLDQPGEVQVEISVSGVIKNELLIQEAISVTDRVDYTRFEWPGATPGRLDGDFYLSTFTLTGEYQGGATFEATFLSTGAITFTAAL